MTTVYLIRKKKINTYEANMWKYGIYTLLYLLQQYEQEENYEECSVLLEALNEIKSTGLGTDISQRWHDNIWGEIGLAMNECGEILGIKNLTGIHFRSNVIWYAEQIKLEITQCK